MRTARGFTLIEVLVVVAIVSFISTIILGDLNSARETSKVKTTARQARELERAIYLYFNDIRQPPPVCDNQCLTDPLRTNVVLHGWNGPYFGGDWLTLEHPWGGHLSFFYSDYDSDGLLEPVIGWNDDAPGAGPSDNSGQVPTPAMQEIDEILDDGNLTTGNVRQSPSTIGELLFEITFLGPPPPTI